jgi:hypothetical protein
MYSLLQGIDSGTEVGAGSGAIHSGPSAAIGSTHRLLLERERERDIVFLSVGMPLLFLAETRVSGTICSQRRGKPKHPTSKIPVIQFKHSEGTRRSPSSAAPSMTPNDSFFDAVLFIRIHTAADKSQVPTRTKNMSMIEMSMPIPSAVGTSGPPIWSGKILWPTAEVALHRRLGGQPPQ